MFSRGNEFRKGCGCTFNKGMTKEYKFRKKRGTPIRKVKGVYTAMGKGVHIQKKALGTYSDDGRDTNPERRRAGVEKEVRVR